GLLNIADRAGAHDRDDAGRGKLGRETSYGFLVKTVEHQRGLERFQIVGNAFERSRTGVSRAGGLAGHAGARPGRRRFHRLAAVHGVDLQHFRHRGHTGNRFLGKLADAHGEGSRQFAVKVDGATAHAGDDTRVFDLLAVQAYEDNVTPGTVDVL